jgi:hypothetical protein
MIKCLVENRIDVLRAAVIFDAIDNYVQTKKTLYFSPFETR